MARLYGIVCTVKTIFRIFWSPRQVICSTDLRSSESNYEVMVRMIVRDYLHEFVQMSAKTLFAEICADT